MNGRIYDPANGRNGAAATLCVRDGRVVAESALDDSALVFDARGMAVLPGGVDMHAHIAGPKVSAARRMRPEDHRDAPVRRTAATRSGVMGSTPSTFATGYAYARLGYTTVIDAAVSPLGARHAHDELADTPIIDKGFLALLGNNEYVLRCVRQGEAEKLVHFVAWLLGAVKAYGIKVVNPGGVAVWKDRGGNVAGLDDGAALGVTPRQILLALAQAALDLDLPHPVHVHANDLGQAGNWTTTLDTMRALEGRRAHLAHIQFHSYGGERGGLPASRVADLAGYVNAHPNLSVDVGQVMFGDTTSMTGDGPVGRYLHQVTRRKWLNADVELESGCGIVPVAYRRRSHIHATQWAIGLQWFLLMEDPWRIALSTDHPNGASFLAYPAIVNLLMDREARREACRAVNQRALARAHLLDLEREYSLYDIAIVTRAAPARLLGLAGKGHLGIGADADIAVYDDHGPWAQTFGRPRLVVKGGEIVARDGEVARDVRGRTFSVEPPWDRAIEPDIRKWFRDFHTVEFENYRIDA